jgi:hypothetical protein
VTERPGAGGNLVDRQLHTEGQGLRRRNNRPCHRSGRIALHRDLDEASLLLEPQHAIAVAAMARQHKSRADIGMAGKGHLGRAMEDAHTGIIGRIVGWQDERCLAVVHLRRERLHLPVGKPARIGEDSQRIATEGAVGEDVYSLVRKARHGRLRRRIGLSRSLSAKPAENQYSDGMRSITFADCSQRHDRRKRASRIPLFANATEDRRSPQLQNVSSLN